MALVSATHFKTIVQDFNFSHILDFFTKLPDRQHKEMFTNKKESGTPRFVVELVFSTEYNDKDRKDHPGFDVWFTRQHGDSRASQVLFDYAPMQHIDFGILIGDVDAYEKSGIRNVHDFRLLTSRIALARSRL